MKEQFLSAEPFPHLVLDGAVLGCVAEEAWREFDAVPADAWHVYDGPDEAGKRACNGWAAIKDHAPVCHALLSFLSSAGAARLFASLTGIDGLEPDPVLYGGGLHAMPPGTQLGLHIDNERHPTTANQRRLNAILYLNEIDECCEQSEQFGGRLQLWGRSRRTPAAQIIPRPGRIVLMETGTHSYHSVEPIVHAASRERRSLATYFWSPPRARARFLPAAGEEMDPETEAARLARSR
jgi:hypothetical protein